MCHACIVQESVRVIVSIRSAGYCHGRAGEVKIPLHHSRVFLRVRSGKFCFDDTALGRDTPTHGQLECQWPLPFCDELGDPFALETVTISDEAVTFPYLGVVPGDDTRVSGQRFYGNDINDIHRSIRLSTFWIIGAA